MRKSGWGQQIPSIFTAASFPLDGETNNPVYSYTYQREVQDHAVSEHERYQVQQRQSAPVYVHGLGRLCLQMCMSLFLR
jgi:hypothetical protein